MYMSTPQVFLKDNLEHHAHGGFEESEYISWEAVESGDWDKLLGSSSTI